MPWFGGGSSGGGGSDVFRLEYFNATPAQTVFNLASAPASTTTVMGYVNGELAENGVDYSVVGNVFTWNDVEFTLDTGDVVAIYYQV
jgi:hypothetical protein